MLLLHGYKNVFTTMKSHPSQNEHSIEYESYKIIANKDDACDLSSNE